MQYDVEAINRLMKNRRSVFPKQFEAGRQIPSSQIWQILENATWAPNHKLTEPWLFTVFTGDGLRKFATFQSELYKAEAGVKFQESKYQKLRDQPLLASHIVSIGMKRSPGNKVPEIEEIAAVACAVQNIYLSTTAYGLGGYWTTGGVTYFENAKSFFGLAGDDKLMGFFYFGFIKDPSPQASRISVREKVTWIE